MLMCGCSRRTRRQSCLDEPLDFTAEAERFKTTLMEMEKEGFIDKTFSITMKQLGVPDLKPAKSQ